MTNLALFDFDGTITFDDTFAPFILSSVRPARLAVGKIALGPMLAAYRLGLVQASVVRRCIVRLGFQGIPEAEVRSAGELYSRSRIPASIRPNALERIRWHQSQGDNVVVVSASLNYYLDAWCREVGVSLICNELESRRGVLTGRYEGVDCCGPEKLRRIRMKYRFEQHPLIYAYGDSPEDDSMMSVAHRKYYKWKEMF